MAWYNLKRSKKEKDAIEDSTKKSASPTPTYPIITNSNFIARGIPVWRNLTQLTYLLKCYRENPIVQAVINIKAEALSNVLISVKDLKTGDIIPLDDYEKDKGKLRDLLSQPNPLETTTEWLRNLKVNYEVFGNSYVYASVPVGFESSFDYTEINTLKNLPPYNIVPILTGKWLDATEKSDIISAYQYTNISGNPVKLDPNTVMHTNGINIQLDEHFTEGESKLVALTKPISNIDSAYKARNVLMENRGAQGIISPDSKDEAVGAIPIDADQKKEILEEYSRVYGIADGQYPHVISPVSLKYQKTTRSTKELMLFEEVESDAIAVCNSFNVPELLVKYYIKGATFENQDASEKRLYDSTIIPETNDLFTAINNFFKTKKLGIELIGTYNHLNILQINKKEEAETTQIKEETARNQFMIGAIDYNGYLSACGLPNDPKIGNKRIWELGENMLNAIKGFKNVRQFKS